MARLFNLVLLAAPVANAAMASYMATVPQSIRALVDSDQCDLPAEFSVTGFTGTSEDGGETFESFEFGFSDADTGIDTLCQFNSSSDPIVIGGRTPRFACNDGTVQFIFQDGSLTMVERACPDDQGQADYEAAGTAPLEIVCGGGGNSTCGVEDNCQAPDVDGRFFSLNPVPT